MTFNSPRALVMSAGLALLGCVADRASTTDPAARQPWPGVDDVRTVDDRGVFAGNMSGLVYDMDDPAAPTVLWAVRNYPGTLFRLVQRDGRWSPDTVADWTRGRALRFTDGGGDVDAEGLTLVGVGAGRGAYIASERDNDQDDVSRNMVLRFDPSQTGPTLRPTHSWDLSADLPVVEPNKGLEAIAWIPDAHLVAAGFVDERTGAAYDPALYTDHGDGLFVVGLEADGAIYAYSLDHRTSTALRVARVPSGLRAVMALEYDEATRELWAHCDDVCDNTAHVLAVDTAAAGATRGRLVVRARYARPATLPNSNIEGFTIAPRRACVNGQRPVIWADDSETGGHALRSATLPCPTAER
jgi:hypothetical protein